MNGTEVRLNLTFDHQNLIIAIAKKLKFPSTLKGVINLTPVVSALKKNAVIQNLARTTYKKMFVINFNKPDN